MKKISRLFLFGSLTLILLAAACAPEGGTSTPEETLVAGTTSSPAATDSTTTAGTATTSTAETATASTTETPTADTTQLTPTTDTTLTPSTPVTGDVILLACQFCVDTMAHALLVMPETTTFDVIEFSASLSSSDTDSGCNTVDTFSDRQVVLCRAPENTSFTMTLCANGGTDCRELVVDLQSCPVTTSGTGVPTETETLQPGAVTNTPAPGITATPTPSTITPTP